MLYGSGIHSLPPYSSSTEHQQGKFHDAYHGYYCYRTGTEFHGHRLHHNGNRSVDLSTVTISEANDVLTFTMPRPPQGTCSLAITTMGGTAEVPGFYPLENIVLNYDDIGSFSWGRICHSHHSRRFGTPYFSDGQCYQLPVNFLHGTGVGTIAEHRCMEY